MGLAIGDALGTTLEFAPRNDQNTHKELIGGGPFDMPPGGWTDDTSMALCLADSLIAKPDFDAEDLMNRFVNWWQHGYNSHSGVCFDIGMTTQAALTKYLDTGNPYAGNRDPKSAGNGSIMRLAPVVLAFHSNKARLVEVARLQSRTTHAAEECEDYCARLASDLHDIVFSNERPHSDLTKSIVRTSGYVKDTYDAAIWSVASTDNFKDALITSVNLGGDADTIGAVTGQLAGAKYGYSQIPKVWLDTLVWREKIEQRAEALIVLSAKL